MHWYLFYNYFYSFYCLIPYLYHYFSSNLFLSLFIIRESWYFTLVYLNLYFHFYFHFHLYFYFFIFFYIFLFLLLSSFLFLLFFYFHFLILVWIKAHWNHLQKLVTYMPLCPYLTVTFNCWQQDTGRPHHL